MNKIAGRDLFNWCQQAKQAAIASKIDLKEINWLVQAVTDLTSLDLRLNTFSNRPQIISSKSLSELNKLWQKRLQERLPVQYLVETVFWRRFQLKVTPAVLIPRPETELIIDIALKHNRIKSTNQHWVDLGTGSGAIAFGLADVLPAATIHAVDLSRDALKIAQDNAKNLNFTQIN
ncbi:MAG: HemK family protein methyltransferase, partial [Cyanobacteria bacterium P01_C01_bin.72]